MREKGLRVRGEKTGATARLVLESRPCLGGGKKYMTIADLEVRVKRALARSPEATVEELAKNCGVSSRQLRRHFQECLGRAPHQWVEGQTVEVVKGLLLAGKAPKEVCAKIGYKHLSHLYRKFKHATGMTPRQFVVAARSSAVRHPAKRIPDSDGQYC